MSNELAWMVAGRYTAHLVAPEAVDDRAVCGVQPRVYEVWEPAEDARESRLEDAPPPECSRCLRWRAAIERGGR